MPWCETCDKWRAPNALLPDGSCPRCSSVVDHGAASAGGAAAAQAGVKVPWHFWLMVGAAGVYLGWRVIQGLITLL